MSTFVIKVYEFGVGDYYYKGEDERLWEWLLAEDIYLSLRPGEDENVLGGARRVLTPEGYVFCDDLLVPNNADVAMPPTELELRDWGYVSVSQPEVDKVQMLILSPYDYVTPIDADEFKALGIDSDRVFEITVGLQ
jgi:hypothetical protein